MMNPMYSMKSNQTGIREWVFWVAPNATNRTESNTRMRPPHGRSQLCGFVWMLCFHPLQCLFLFPTNQRLDEFAAFGAWR